MRRTFTFNLLVILALVAMSTSAFAQLYPGDSTTFVKDVTYPDGSIVKAGAKLTKTWRIHNRGTVSWTNRELRIDGDTQGFKLVKAQPFSAASTVDVDISVNLLAAKKPGHYKLLFKQWVKDNGEWKLAFPNKQGVWLDVNVE